MRPAVIVIILLFAGFQAHAHLCEGTYQIVAPPVNLNNVDRSARGTPPGPPPPPGASGEFGVYCPDQILVKDIQIPSGEVLVRMNTQDSLGIDNLIEALQKGDWSRFQPAQTIAAANLHESPAPDGRHEFSGDLTSTGGGASSTIGYWRFGPQQSSRVETSCDGTNLNMAIEYSDYFNDIKIKCAYKK